MTFIYKTAKFTPVGTTILKMEPLFSKYGRFLYTYSKATITQCHLSLRFFCIDAGANLKAITYESVNLNRIIADKSHRVIVRLQLHGAIYRLRFYSNSLIHILSLSNSHNNVASLQKNRGDKSHCVIL